MCITELLVPMHYYFGTTYHVPMSLKVNLNSHEYDTDIFIIIIFLFCAFHLFLYHVES